MGRLGGFFSSTALVGIVSVATIPLAISAGGPASWGAVATGQAIGGMFAVAVGLGWPVTGAAYAAAMSSRERKLEYQDSVRARLAVMVPAGCVSVVLAVVLVPDLAWAAATASLATCLVGLSAVWFFVAARDPSSALLFDALPRSLSLLVGAVAAALMGNIIWYSVGLLASSSLAFIISHFRIVKFDKVRGPEIGETSSVWARTRRQLFGAAASGTSATYLVLPTILTAALFPSLLPAFALGDRILKLAATCLRPLAQVAQGEFGGGGALSASRAYRVIAVIGPFAFAGGGLVGIAAPSVADLLSGGEIALGTEEAIALGAALAASVMSQSTGLAILSAWGRSRAVFASSILGGLVCVPLLMTLPARAGLAGALWSVAFAELAVMSYQLISVAAEARKRS